MKELQALCERLDFKHLHIEWKLLFSSKMLSLKNDVVQICFNCFNSSSECCAFTAMILMLVDVLQRPLRKRCIMRSVILLLLLFKCENM